MINLVWLGILTVGLVCSIATGRVAAVTDAVMEAARLSVEVAMGLLGVMAFWLGLAKLIEESGLLKGVVTLLRPVTARLFPEIPRQDPAHGAIAMNLGANMLGMGNAATPFGLKAMQRLQELNRHRPTASKSMCTFLALNTACPCLFPTMIIGLRSAAGSRNPGEIIGTTLASTVAALTTALLVDRIMRAREEKRHG